jgi:hypothetical protein
MREKLTMNDKGKAIFATLYAVAALFVPLVDSGFRPDAEGWTQISIGVATAVITYIVPVIPEAPWAKTFAAIVLLLLQTLVTVIGDGINSADVLMLAFTLAGALGIQIAPATSANGVHVNWGKDSYALAA